MVINILSSNYLLKLKAFADCKFHESQNLTFALGRKENIVEKRKKCWLPAFFSFFFSSPFYKASFSTSLEVKGEELNLLQLII